ncbi:uncharacterized protein LACBIDRAFT_188295 [Laccaria bicolor S238N-H82]|uniref:Predicted protein n=1 Tax=Laccaria bicolor (strain S238N-H82 / ATCC MYA-4686) TaxID=486041 RepID=B0CX44_LACBS|nr:uncharacterized protein LACBIDRAFT_188295 [Laccaria bicolor S238N-H82]EDR13188.1 predicted protein [Laccaria bicolor S238N-H82]|eukprot:XP_001875686.1 predicted protein [Laccaria bicolor S238N-H82]
MSATVKLYVYDLSKGMARQLSRQLTGRQIDGIWHTSVVVFGKEIFYGLGINTTPPGRSHHGAPMQVLDMGETSIDEETFTEYLEEMRSHYTADKYHLLEFNCNSFTNDCVGFLTGGSIPSFISDLPTDFLSTPFGQSLRPTIDAMYRRPSPGVPAIPANAPPNPELAASILQSSLTSPIHAITNPPAFHAFLKSHRAAVAFFTSNTCPPCRMIEPVFERLSEEKGLQEGRDGAGFAKVDIDVGMGRNLAAEYSVRATPTFMFFLDGEKIEEIKGADANELRAQVDLLLFQAFPPHPHTKLSLPAIQALELKPILFSQIPPVDTAQVKQTLTTTVTPYLKARFLVPPNAPKAPARPLPSATPAILTPWAQATASLATALPIETLFPLVDTWRLALLDPAVGAWIAATPSFSDPINLLLPQANSALQTPSKSSRNYVLTFLRLLCNATSSAPLAQKLLQSSMRQDVTAVLVPSLLHDDVQVRTAAASLAFNVAAVLQKPRVEAVRTGRRLDEPDDVEMVSAVVEALDREKDNEEVVHRLTACLAFLLRLSSFHESHQDLLEALQTRDKLKGKLMKGEHWNGEGGVGKKEVRKLIDEVAGRLCP